MINDVIQEMEEQLEELKSDVNEWVDSNDNQHQYLRNNFNIYVQPFSYNPDVGILVTNNSKRDWEYYMGFEYIDREEVKTIGDYTIYSVGADRVQDIIDRISAL